jgi:hypothetical protein
MTEIADDMQAEAQTTPKPSHLYKPGQSGNPSGRMQSKRFLALRADIVADLGGEDTLSGIDRALVAQIVTLLVRAETTSDVNSAVRASNAGARLLATIASKRKARQSSASSSALREYLAALPDAAS